MPDAHAPFSPSATERWLACPASVPPLGVELKDSSGLAAARGTCMHEIAEEILKGTHRVGPRTFEHNGSTHIVTGKEQQEHVKPYVDYVRQLAADTGGRLYVEHQVTIVPELCWGTSDAIIVCDYVTHIVDLKTGGYRVRPDSPPLKTYAVGALKEFNIKCDCVLHICQAAYPDQAPVRVGYKDLVAHERRIKDAIKAWKAGAAPTPTNINNYCKWCPYHAHNAAKNNLPPCNAWHLRAVEALKLADARVDAVAKTPKLQLPEPSDVRIDHARWLLTYFPAMVKWFKSFQKYWDEKAARDGAPLGFDLVEATTKRKWRGDLDPQAIAERLTAVAETLEVDFSPWKPAPLVSFTEAEKVLGEKMIEKLVEKPEGRKTLKVSKEAQVDLAGLCLWDDEEEVAP